MSEPSTSRPLASSWSPTAARSPSASSAPPTSWASAPSPSTPTKTASPCTASRPTRPTASASPASRSAPTSTSPASSPSPASTTSTPSIPATASSPRTPTSPAPAARPASSSSARAPRSSNSSATRSSPAASPQQAGVPDPPRQRDGRAPTRRPTPLADKLGYPVIVKAAMGGGGRGMRVALTPDKLDDALDQARREAGTAFGVADVFLEKFIRRARHIEVQLLGDQHGNLVHLFERDCSVQRRHQKVVEIAPRRTSTPACATRILDAALAVGRAVRLDNAGTVEFLVDADTRRVLLHRGQPAHPGRAHRHRAGHRLRHRQVPDPHRPGPAARRPGDRPRRSGGRPHARLRHPVPRHHRGPGQQLPARLRPAQQLPLGQRHGHPPRRRLGLHRRGHHAVLRLAAGQGDGPRPALRRRRPPHEAQLCRSSASAASRRTSRSSSTSSRTRSSSPAACTTRFIDETPELFHLPRRQDRATQAAHLHRRGDRQRPPARPGRPSCRRAGTVPTPRRRRRPAGTRVDAAAGGHARPASASSGRRSSPPGCWSRSGCWSPTRPSATPTSRCWRRACAPTTCCASPRSTRPGCRSCSRWRCGAGRRSTRRCASSRSRPGSAWPSCASACRTSSSRCCCARPTPSATPTIPITSSRRSSRSRPQAGIDLFRIFDALNGLPNLRLAIEAVRDTGMLCEAAVCYTGDILDPKRDQVQPQLLRRPGEGAGEARRQPARHQGHGRPVQALRGPGAGARAASRKSACRSTSTRTTAPAGRSPRTCWRPRRAWTSSIAPWRRSPGMTSQPSLHAVVEALRFQPRDTRPRRRGDAGGGRLLAGGAPPVRAVRDGPAVAAVGRLPERDARRPVHEPVPAGAGAGPGRRAGARSARCTPRSTSCSATSSR